MKKKLKVLHLVDTFYPVIGGVSSVVDQSCSALSKYADVTVGAVKAKNYKDPVKPYKIIRCKGFYNKITKDGMAFTSLDKEFRKSVEEGGFDLIHCHTAGNFMTYALKIGKKLNIPIVTTIHSYLKPDAKKYLKLELLANMATRILIKKTNKANYIWAVSSFCAEKVKPFGITKPIKIMNNAIDFVPPKNCSALTKAIYNKHNLDKKTFVVSFISRMIKEKNVDLVINSINFLKDRHLNLKVFLVGGGNYFDALKEKVRKLKLEDSVIMTGMIKDRKLLSAYYASSDLILFPSCIDAAGLIHIEAAAFEKPTLVIKETAPAENIKNKENGLISENNEKDFASMILYAYNNRDELKLIGKRAKDTLYKTYSDKSVTDNILEEYHNIIEDFKKTKAKNKNPK